MKIVNSIIKNYCAQCNCQSRHTVLYSISQKANHNEDFCFEEELLVVQCLGCETISFRREYVDENSYPEEDSSLQVDIYTYPNSQPKEIRVSMPAEYEFGLPRKIRIIYSETIDALNSDCLILCAAGFRALIEAVCMQFEVGGKNLEIRINKLYTNGHISKKDRDRLHAIRFLGNDSLHEIAIPNKVDLLLVHEIVGNLLNGLYLLEKKISNRLPLPIKDYDEFKSFLALCLIEQIPGTKSTLRKMLLRSKKLVNEDLEKFEVLLKKDIEKGEFTKLRMVKADTDLKEQMYEVVS